MPRLDIAGGAYEHDSLNISAQRCVNLYLNVDNTGTALGGKQLLSTPGLKEMVDLSASSCRGMIEVNGRLFVVADSTLYELFYTTATDSMTSTNRGAIGTSEGSVSLETNGTEILIADGTVEGYLFDLSTNTLSTIADADFPGVKTVTFLDSYLIVNPVDSSQMYASGISDGTSWDALDVATAESKPDKLVAIKAFNDELWAFGEKSVEVWYNAANATGFPLSPRTDIVFDVGCGAAFSVVSFKNMLFWLGEDGSVYQANGYSPEIISTKSITRAISEYATISDAIAYAYTEAGHYFYVLTFPDAGATWVYDLTSKSWHERSHLTDGGLTTRHRGNCYASFARKHFVGDYNSGRIHRMGTDLLDDNGAEIQRLRTTRHGNVDNKSMTIYNVELLAEAGTGIVTGQGVDPQISLEFSSDGGHTWSNEKWRSLGKIGEYQKRIRWDRLGTHRNFTLRFKVSDPVRVTLIDASSDIAVGL